MFTSVRVEQYIDVLHELLVGKDHLIEELCFLYLPEFQVSRMFLVYAESEHYNLRAYIMKVVLLRHFLKGGSIS